MPVNKVVYGDTTVIDLTDSTLSDSAQLLSGVTAYDRSGTKITGTAQTSGNEWTSGIYKDSNNYIKISPLAAAGGVKMVNGYLVLESTQAGSGSSTLGTKTITANGTYAASSDSLDGYSSLVVNVPTGITPTGTKTISITSDGTTTEDVTNYASAEITVNVPTGTARTSADLTASGATVTVPAGLYAEAASKSVANGSATTPATTITANPSISVSASGLITATASASQSITPTVSPGYVSNGTAGTISVSGNNTEQLTTMAAQTVTPTTSSQTVSTSGKYMTGDVTVDPIPSQYIVPSGSTTIEKNGTYDVTDKASVVVNVPSSGGMNVQMYNDYDYVSETNYTETDVTLTVAVTGTYDISWVGWRNTTSGTSGSQLYRNGSSYGSAITTFQGSYGQSVNLSGVSLNAGDVLVVRARARNTSYRMYVANLVIVQTA